MRTRIVIESNVASVTRGMVNLLASSINPESQLAAENVYKLARLDALVSKQNKQGDNYVDDYSFSFFDLDETEQGLIDAVSKELTDFINTFRGNNPSKEQGDAGSEG